MISLRGVCKLFPGARAPAVDRLSLEIAAGEIVVLVGPSGCGKTTTMKMINRLIDPSSGCIEVNGVDVMKHDPVELRRGIGYVIQSTGLLPHRTVEQNIATVPRLLGWDKPRIRERTLELMAMLELDEDLLPRYPNALSGGQRQRVGVARALAADPPVMLMDEPFGAVDPIVRVRLQDQLLEIQSAINKTIVFVTHDIDEAIKMADRIAILNKGAALEQFASPEEILRSPASDFVESFVGEERGLKRLSLIRVTDVALEQGPVVSPSAPIDEARREMERFSYGGASVVDDGRLLGWVDASALDGCATVADARLRPFDAHVAEDNTLRQALDAAVTSPTGIAVVATADRGYAGVLSVERISREIAL